MNESKFFMPSSGQKVFHYRDEKEIYEDSGSNINEAYFGQNIMSFKKLGNDGIELTSDSNWEKGLRMVFDDNTGLYWEVKSPDLGEVNFCSDTYTWDDAQKVYIKRLNDTSYGGFDDWRIPNKDELRSIINYSFTNPAVDTSYFENCKTDDYWTSVTYEMQPNFGWVLFFGFGSGIAKSKNAKRYVIAVRGGYEKLFGVPDKSRFLDNDDGTVTDKTTGLMWQKSENPRMNWYDAIDSCEKMNLAGYDDWRLPNIKELNTILNLNYEDGWWYFKDVFPAEGLNPPLLHYFSSSSFQNSYAWVTNFCFGYDGYYANKNTPLLYRAVRNSEASKKHRKLFVLPSTGQNQAFDVQGNLIKIPSAGEPLYGIDSTMQKNPLSYKAMEGNKTVLDLNTGLLWEKKSSYSQDMNYKSQRYTWNEAFLYIEKLNSIGYEGYRDWRLPNREELRSIVKYDDTVPTLDTEFFEDILPEFYWAKEEYSADNKLAWGIYFAYGCAISFQKTLAFPVIAVRGGYDKRFGESLTGRFVDNGDGTITDCVSRLMWVKEESPLLTLEEALNYCSLIKTADYKDWRLPNIKELATLIDVSYKEGCWFDRTFFPNVVTKPQGFYLSSTTFGGTFGWGVNFQFGYDGYYADRRNGKYPIRPVRSIED